MAEIDTTAALVAPRTRHRVSLLDVHIEFASHTDNALFMALFAAIAGGLAATGAQWRDALWLGVGLLVFIPQEYFTHVLVLHRKLPQTQRVYEWFYRLHYGHHDHPRRHDLMYMPAWLTLPMMAANAALLWAATPDFRAFAAAYAGAVLGYVVFEFSHLLCHVPYAPKSALWKHVRSLHLLHHFSDERRAYAVAPWSLFIDRLMGTAMQRNGEERSPTCRHLGLPADHPWLAAARQRFAHRSNGNATGSKLWLRIGSNKE
jgi:4-hydroxysphinganine ceramide fatty acyl 2-hydroxylase